MSNSRAKATPTQLNHMVEFMKIHHECASGLGTGLQGKVELQKKWQELTDTLNALGGPMKTVEKWKQTWRDLRNSVKKKAIKNKKEYKGDGPGGTGNGPAQLEMFSVQDEAVMSVIGPIAIFGMDGVACTMPAEGAPGSPAVVVPTTLQAEGDVLSMPPAVMPAIPEPEPSPMCSTQDAERSNYEQLPLPITPSLPQAPLRPRMRSRRRLTARTETFDSQILQYEKERLEVQQRQIAVREKKLQLEERRLLIEDRKAKAFESEETETMITPANVKLEPGGEASGSQIDPIAVAVKTEPCDDGGKRTNETLAPDVPAINEGRGRKRQRKNDDTTQHTQGLTTARASSSVPTRDVDENSLLAEGAIKTEEIEIHEEGFS